MGDGYMLGGDEGRYLMGWGVGGKGEMSGWSGSRSIASC